MRVIDFVFASGGRRGIPNNATKKTETQKMKRNLKTKNSTAAGTFQGDGNSGVDYAGTFVSEHQQFYAETVGESRPSLGVALRTIRGGLSLIMALVGMVCFGSVDADAQTYSIATGSTYTANAGASQTLSLTVSVPSGTSKLKFETWGGSGDADLFFASSGTASRSNYSARSTGSTSVETITVDNPRAGNLSFAIYAYTAFSGVQLRATLTQGQLSQVATPNISPGGQSTMNPITCSISCSTSSATIRFTLDGTNPNSGSPVYSAPFTLWNSSTVKAQAFKNGMTASSVATVSYEIVNQSVNVTTLRNNESVTGLSGSRNSEKYYKVPVPAGQSKLEVKTANGDGDVDVYLRQGSRPTTSTYTARGYSSGNAETVTITNPEPGDWYVMVRGYAAFSGVTLTARYEGSGLVTKAQAEGVFQRTISNEKLASLNACLSKYEINTPTRIRHFLAQCHAESGGLQFFAEIADGWAYDKSVNPDKARDLGNTSVGDGPKYKGAGAIQVTGKNNYRSFSDTIRPEDSRILSEGVTYVSVAYPFEISGFWWKVLNNMNARCDQGMTVTQISKAVNLGNPYADGTPYHLDVRIDAYNRALRFIP